MDIIIILMIAIAGAGLAAAIAFGVQGYLIHKAKEQEPTLKDRISNLTKNLESAATVITEIETEISKRSNLVQQLETDIERFNRIKEVNQAQVEAIAQTLTIPLVKESRKSVIINSLVTFGVALVFFAIGYFVGGI